MSETNKSRIGTIQWTDLTVANAEEVRDFYCAVAGWEAEPLDMGGYADFVMQAPGSGEGVAGVCHARGENANVPPQWLVYITVADADASARVCAERGGKVLDGPRAMGSARFCVVQDPAGAVAALISGGEPEEPSESAEKESL